jgi:hypothetical protein
MESAVDRKTPARILVGDRDDDVAQHGIPWWVVDEPDRVDTLLSDSLAFIDRAAPSEMMIISTPVVLEPGCRARAEPVGSLSTIEESGALRSGAAGADTIPELVDVGDRVVNITGKVGFNARSHTALEGLPAARDPRCPCGRRGDAALDRLGRARGVRTRRQRHDPVRRHIGPYAGWAGVRLTQQLPALQERYPVPWTSRAMTSRSRPNGGSGTCCARISRTAAGLPASCA